MKTNQIQIRDPFVLTDEREGAYYLFGTTDKNCSGAGPSFAITNCIFRNDTAPGGGQEMELSGSLNMSYSIIDTNKINGERINLGRYGNTAEASRSGYAGAMIIMAR